ncbi:MAG TPA: hypothetical protein EYQ18_23705, partial [Candidatus Handelsmanbacteria bacterium]|nr:hypothetical protein [Candidatus Handelsmanbacteria bacterium]
MSSFDPHNENTEYIEGLYQQYLSDPDSLDVEWRYFFKGFEFGFLRSEVETSEAEVVHPPPPGEE